MTVFSTAAATGRKRRGEGHTRREEILHAAKELFLEQGYDSTTIRKIADRVGISAPALYLYFKDKEALMLALCDQTFGHLVEAISEIEKTVAEPLERIRRFGEAYASFGLTHPDEPVKRLFRTVVQWLIQLLLPGMSGEPGPEIRLGSAIASWARLAPSSRLAASAPPRSGPSPSGPAPPPR